MISYFIILSYGNVLYPTFDAFKIQADQADTDDIQKRSHVLFPTLLATNKKSINV